MAAMRIDLADLLRPHAREPAPPVALPDPPLAGSRAQRMQRLQVGVFGIAAMVLVVGLANIIQTNAERTESQVVAEAVDEGGTPSAEQPAADPLAEAGVVPGMPTENKTKPAPSLPADAPAAAAP